MPDIPHDNNKDRLSPESRHAIAGGTTSSHRTVGLMVIATGRYLEFAKQLAVDIDERSAQGHDVVLNLFTDRITDVKDWQSTLRSLTLNALQLPALRWPEASLLRFEIFQRFWSDLHGDDLVYIDADMRVEKSFLGAVASLAESELLGVSHPGYFNRGFRGPKGTWETRKISAAWVPRRKRRQYAYGGVWMGTRDAINDVSKELSHRVELDRTAGVTAIWHDESHWNWYVAEHKIDLLSPAYSFVPSYPWLSGIDPVILAVDKGTDFHREESDPTVVSEWG